MDQSVPDKFTDNFFLRHTAFRHVTHVTRAEGSISKNNDSARLRAQALRNFVSLLINVIMYGLGIDSLALILEDVVPLTHT